MASGDFMKCTGVMITASHNAEVDNGVKIVDVDGGMLAQSWEEHAITIANTRNLDEFPNSFREVVNKAASSSALGVVIIGRDTRPHSLPLSRHVSQGVLDMNGQVFDIGEVTTPQLHFVVQKFNEMLSTTSTINTTADRHTAVLKCLASYYDTIIGGYFRLCASAESCNTSISRLVLDCACGVGAVAARAAQKRLQESNADALAIDIRNDIGSGLVNDDCGAEYVQKNQVPPKHVDDRGVLLCSYDGDADRIVFHAFLPAPDSDLESRWTLFDGDKIAAVMSLFLCKELAESGLSKSLTMAVVQTAYANGSSTKFLRSHGIDVKIAKTGVKYLHHVALEYDVGVYFEANGHGTVLLSNNFHRQLQALQSSVTALEERQKIALERLQVKYDTMIVCCHQSLTLPSLQAFTMTINPAVGDAFSDMLVTVAALKVSQYFVHQRFLQSSNMMP
jgi:phosphoacetylglucosamine mutase